MIKKRTWIKALLIVPVLLVLLSAVGYWKFGDKALVGAGYDAKMICSGVFVSGRDPADVMAVDLAATEGIPYGHKIDAERQSVHTSLFYLAGQIAVFREGLGCTLVLDENVDALKGRAALAPPLPAPLPVEVLWPEGQRVDVGALPPEIDRRRLKTALESAFVDPDPDQPMHTRAVVAVYKGRIIGEKYAAGFSKDTPLLGWSMTKSVTSALVGILVKQGRLNLHQPAPVPEWQQAQDPRAAITIDHLLRMESGLKFIEEYESNAASDCVRMLFQEPDMGAFAAAMPPAAPPGTRWSYSSGTTNIISRLIRQTFADDRAYYAFVRSALLDKLGMRKTVIETDAAGTLVGSSYMYATGRDWARMGLLFLNDGVWRGERILPEGWVAYNTTPTPHAPRGCYGAHFWLNAGAPGNPTDRDFPQLPTDLYYMSGHDGQMVAIIPGRHLVVVRLGFTPAAVTTWDEQTFLKNFVDAVQPPAVAADGCNAADST